MPMKLDPAAADGLAPDTDELLQEELPVENESPAPEEPTSGLDRVRQTLNELQSQRSAWERDLAALFDSFDSLASQFLLQTQQREAEASLAAARAEAIQELEAARKRADECWLELAGQQEALSRKQENAQEELSHLREMIEQQTDLLTAFIGAATQFADPKSGPDPLLNAVQAEFAQAKKGPSGAPKGKPSRPGLA